MSPLLGPKHPFLKGFYSMLPYAVLEKGCRDLSPWIWDIVNHFWHGVKYTDTLLWLVWALSSTHIGATEELANKKYGTLVKFLQYCGYQDVNNLNKGGNKQNILYKPWYIQSTPISKVIEQDLKSELAKSTFITISVDLSTPMSVFSPQTLKVKTTMYLP